MLHAKFVGKEIKTTGQISEGDVYPNFCCDGFGWEVALIMNNVWGVCQNPDCPNYKTDIGPDDPYRGVDYINQEDLEEWLASRKPNKANTGELLTGACPECGMAHEPGQNSLCSR